MSSASNRRWPHRCRLGRTGVTTVEFAVVALLFLTVLIGCMDLGRYYLIEHSLRTVVAEAAREVQVENKTTYNTVTVIPSSANFGAITPFVDNSNLTLTVFQFPTRPGVTKISVTATYAFTSYSPIWRALDGNITETTVLWY
jgi:Flp pilus assembly protein TadG